jgi:sugar phosphate isomerase/epimerase
MKATTPAKKPATRATLPFKPEYMRISILTAALQELTPRKVRDADPDRAIEDWIGFAVKAGVDRVQLSSALHPSQTDVPPEAMLDPVANHLDLREPFGEARARRVQKALDAAKVTFSDLAYFDNMIVGDASLRRRKFEFMLRVMDAAQRLGVKAVCGFVGRNLAHDMDQNLDDFREAFLPLLKEAKKRGLVYRVEQCPMPGWNTTDLWENNIAYTPATWIALYKIADKAGVGAQFRIHYDPSHAILMGQNTRDVFQFLKDEGHNFLIGGFHVKGQVIHPKAIAGWGYRGQTMQRGDRANGRPNADARTHVNAWKKMGYCTHELPGTARHDPLAYLQNRTVDWLDHQLAARELLDLKVSETDLVVEHEYPDARVQDPEKLLPILQGSCAFTRAIDRAAGDMFALHRVLESQGIRVQGVGREPYRS